MKLSHVLVYSDNTAYYQVVATLLPPDCVSTSAKNIADIQLTFTRETIALLILTIDNLASIEPLLKLAGVIGETPIILVYPRDMQQDIESLKQVLKPIAFLNYPLQPVSFRATVRRALRQSLSLNTSTEREEALRNANERLNQRLQELNAIYTVGKSVALSLDIEETLARAVIASVNLTRAEEGFIILKEGDGLYLRVSAVLGGGDPEFTNQRVSDRMAEQVLSSGRPTMLHRDTKLATGILVRALLYVPLLVPDRGAIGVLGMVNRTRDESFTENQLFALSSVADFAAIAIENAKLYSELNAEHTRLSTILENTEEPIIMTDVRQNLWLWSQRAADAFGIAPDSQGKRFADVIDNPVLLDLFNPRNTELSEPMEISLTDGRIFNAQLSRIAEIGSIAVLQDISNLKELDRLKTEFVSTVSHDLRSPLTTVQGYVSMLDRAGPLTDLQKVFINKTMVSLDYITELITDLLDIGRIEAGYDLEMTAQDMREIILETIQESQLMASEAGITLGHKMPPIPLLVWGNAKRLRQAMENLINNAIKYNRAHGWVHVQADIDNEHVVVSVADSGIGIPAEELPKIFERFYRVKSVGMENIQGTGLGLAIVESVIEKHKGRIWVQSVMGKGSTFYFVLPRHGPGTEALPD